MDSAQGSFGASLVVIGDKGKYERVITWDEFESFARKKEWHMVKCDCI